MVVVGMRSIPASAGEPISFALRDSSDRVYPRECGGTGRHHHQSLPGGGLSPRVRGNHGVQSERANNLGSIPASAGEP